MEKLSPSYPNIAVVPEIDQPQCYPTDTATDSIKRNYSLRSSDSNHSHPKVVPTNSVIKYSVKLPSARKNRQPKIKKATGKLKNKPGRRDDDKDLASKVKASATLPQIEKEMQTMVIANGNQDADAAFQFLSAIHECIKEEENKASDTETMDSEPFEEKEGEKENLIGTQSHFQAFRQKLLFSKENGFHENQIEITNTNTFEQDKTYVNGDSEILSTLLAERLNVPSNLELMVNDLEEVTKGSKPPNEKVEGVTKILENEFLSTKPSANGIKSEPGVDKKPDLDQILTSQMASTKNIMVQICKSKDPELGAMLEELIELKDRNKKLDDLVLQREQKLFWLKTLHADIRNYKYCHHTGAMDIKDELLPSFPPFHF